MSADRLRQAAQKIRETANAAAYGQWHKAGDLPGFLTYEDATHIAFWSPSVALAVAEWLDDVAADAAEGIGSVHPRALDVADLILGGAS
jgi:hypothetical protein